MVVGMRASRFAAGIIGTEVAVITLKRNAFRTSSRLTGIAERAGVPIIAIGEIRRVLAPKFQVTRVIRARIIVIAFDRFPDTGALLTGIRLGAGRPIETFASGKRRMGATVGPRAAVLGTGVAIIAGILVDQTVAIIIDAITCLGRRRGSTAGREPLFCTRAIPLARTELIGHRTGRREVGGCRKLRALTDVILGHALVARGTTDGLDFLTAIALRTWSL